MTLDIIIINLPEESVYRNEDNGKYIARVCQCNNNPGLYHYDSPWGNGIASLDAAHQQLQQLLTLQASSFGIKLNFSII